MLINCCCFYSLSFIMFQCLCFGKNCCSFIMYEQNCYFCSFCSFLFATQKLSIVKPGILSSFCFLLPALSCWGETRSQSWTTTGGQVKADLLAVVNNYSKFWLWRRPESTLFDSQQLFSFCACVPVFPTKIVSSLKTPTTDQLNGDSQSHWRRKSCYAGSSFLWDWHFNQTMKSLLLVHGLCSVEGFHSCS